MPHRPIGWISDAHVETVGCLRPYLRVTCGLRRRSGGNDSTEFLCSIRKSAACEACCRGREAPVSSSTHAPQHHAAPRAFRFVS